MLACALFTIITILPMAQAGGWDVFSNNLATDLAPFLSLFGEQITKQYLSESVRPIDYFIFAMAPMGILTGVVSAIRVCGSPSLRAFIGRAQEGAGNAEAELCTSTSRDVCALYNSGGIARVFGRPKILEVVHDPDYDFNNQNDGKAGIYTFQEFIQRKEGKDLWKKEKPSTRTWLWPWKAPKQPDTEAPAEPNTPLITYAPNLSLNIGIKKQPIWVFHTIAVLGVVLQVGVLAFAGVATYYLKWGNDDKPPDSYACPLVFIGIVLVCCGMFYCAFLIGESTKEDVWHRQKNSKDECSMYWIQPGGQIIGDQTFDAFSHTDSGNRLEKYMTSRRKISTEKFELQVRIAIGITLSGFILQFTGLRGIRSSVSVAQLGVIMVMSMARAALRMQRLKPEDNCFATFPDQVIGHELDWLALSIGRGLINQDVKGSRSGTPTTSDSEERNFWKFSGAADNDERILKRPPPTGLEDVAAKLLAYRTRLALMTYSSTSSTTDATKFKDNMVEVRAQNRQLADLIEATVKTILSKAEIKPNWFSKVQGESNDSQSIFWGFRRIFGKHINGTSSKDTVYLELRRDHEAPGKPWLLKDKLELEGILGLWVWSLKSDPEIETRDPETGLIRSTASNVQLRRILLRDRGFYRELKIWLGNDMNINTDRKYAKHNQNADIEDASALWKAMEGTMATPNSKSYSATDSKPPLIRFFGSSEPQLPRAHTAQENSFLSAAIQGSLVTACAQHIFSSFFASILESVDTIGSVNIQEAETFRLENPFLTELVGFFTEMRLGTSQEALLCIIPSVIPHLEAPSSSKVLQAATKFANDQKGIDFRKAESVLQWAWGICTGSMHICTVTSKTYGDHELAKQATILLGELYRWALMKDSSATTTFAQSGISWLEGKKRDNSIRTCQDTCDIIDRYVTVFKEIPDHEFTDSDLISAMEKADLVKVLVFLTKPPKVMEGKTKGDALCMAAAYGWTEVVFALLELGAGPDFRDKTQRTPLSHAAGNGCIGIVKELLA